MTQGVANGAAIEELRAGFGGELLTPDAQGYDDARSVFNAMVDRRPALVARCQGIADVIGALRLARDAGLPVSVRGGGHSVAGHGVCDDGVVIDMTPMKGVRVDPEARTAWAQAGLNWGELDRETQAFGLAVTGGRVPGTGVAGLTLGGGSGWIERKCGLTVDNVRSIELVTADGRFLVADRVRHPELFWALKGGGGNFGVVTAFEFDLHEVGPVLYGGLAMFPIERATELMRAYRDFAAEAPDEVGGAATILCAPPEEFVPEAVRGKPVLGIVACYVGPLQDGERALAPVREWGPAIDMLGPIPYAQGLQRLIEAGNPPGMQHYWKAGLLGELTDDAIATFLEHATDVCSPLTACIMLPFGGAVARASAEDSPLDFRDAGWNYHILSQWADPADGERNIAWTRAFDAAMAPHALPALYVNFAAEPADEAIRAGFVAGGWERLVAVKDEYDPDNVFRSNTNIPPSGARSNGQPAS
jgi:FAD/FMN-containing dehydrogenase